MKKRAGPCAFWKRENALQCPLLFHCQWWLCLSDFIVVFRRFGWLIQNKGGKTPNMPVSLNVARKAQALKCWKLFFLHWGFFFFFFFLRRKKQNFSLFFFFFF